jgi:hypothetical protein
MILHPLLFAIHPLLAIFAHNKREESASTLLQPMLLGLGVVLLLWLVLGKLVRSFPRAAILVSIGLLAFFSYGHFFSLVMDRSIGSFEYGRQRYFLALWGLAAAGAGLAVLRTRKDLSPVNSLLNVAGLVLCAVPALEILTYAVRNRIPSNAVESIAIQDDPEWTQREPRPNAGRPPDVYYLVFDRYASNKVLQQFYGFDNSEFIAALRSRGFFVADESRCNYASTFLSLISSLNLSHLEQIEREAADSNNRAAVFRLLRDYKVQRYLRSAGYRYFHLGSWWTPTRTNPFADRSFDYGPGLSEFSLEVLRTTLAAPLLVQSLDRSDVQRRRVLFQFERVQELVAEPGPKFVFLHMLAPHPPYLFAPDGSTVAPLVAAQRSEAENYVNQVQYINTRILETIERILQGSAEPPIILVTSDEGPELPEAGGRNRIDPQTALQRTGILNAYHFPGVDTGALYPSITPVNSFRLLFDLYFGARYELLPDRVYWWEDSTYPYRFIDVTTLP